MKNARFTLVRKGTTPSTPSPSPPPPIPAPPRVPARGTPTMTTNAPNVSHRIMVGVPLAGTLGGDGGGVVLGGAALGSAIGYFILFLLAPLPALHLSPTPLATAWPWTTALAHWLFPGAWSASGTFAQNWPYLLLLGCMLLMLVGVYALAVVWAWRHRKSGTNSSRWLLLLLSGTGIFGLILLFQPALFSNDIFNYIFSGRLLAIYHSDPLTTAPIHFANDPYLSWITQTNAPTIYGPFSLALASALVGIGGGPVATLFFFKGIVLLSHMLNTVLVWSILAKVAPGRRLPGTLLYAWNPLVLIELAGSGHLEGLLLTLLLLATWVHIQQRGRWSQIGTLLLFGLASGVNLSAFLVVPLYAWFVIRTQRDIRRAIGSFAWRVLLAMAVILGTYIPFWHGAATFLAVTSAADMQHYVHSPLGLLASPLHWLFGLIAQGTHFPSSMQPIPSADLTLRGSALFLFALLYFALFGRLRRAPTTIGAMRYSSNADPEMLLPGFDTLLTCWSIAILGYIVLVSGSFWPWYLLWVLWAVTLRRFDRLTISIVLLSGTALLMYLLLNFTASPLVEYEPLLIFGIPFVYWISKRTVGAMPRARP